MSVARDVEEIESLHVPHISIERVKEEIIGSSRNELSPFCDVNFGGRVKYEVVVHNGSAYGKSTTLNIGHVIMGTYGTRGLDHFFFGSTAELVLRGALCPVFTLTVKLI